MIRIGGMPLALNPSILATLASTLASISTTILDLEAKDTNKPIGVRDREDDVRRGKT